MPLGKSLSTGAGKSPTRGVHLEAFRNPRKRRRSQSPLSKLTNPVQRSWPSTSAKRPRSLSNGSQKKVSAVALLASGVAVVLGGRQLQKRKQSAPADTDRAYAAPVNTSAPSASESGAPANVDSSHNEPSGAEDRPNPATDPTVGGDVDGSIAPAADAATPQPPEDGTESTFGA